MQVVICFRSEDSEGFRSILKRKVTKVRELRRGSIDPARTMPVALRRDYQTSRAG